MRQPALPTTVQSAGESKHKMATNKLYIIEPTKDGFKGTASGASRAAVTGATQGAVANELHDRFPDASVVAARVRQTSVNSPDKFRKI
jgi:hypothetical protein